MLMVGYLTISNKPSAWNGLSQSQWHRASDFDCHTTHKTACPLPTVLTDLKANSNNLFELTCNASENILLNLMLISHEIFVLPHIHSLFP